MSVGSRFNTVAGLAVWALTLGLGACEAPVEEGRSPAAFAGSCEGFCGGMAPGGCYCDADCAADGDCCADVELTCDPVTSNESLAPWIGTPCVPGEGTCDFEANGSAAECLAFEDGQGESHGFCSVPCAGTCPDADDHATTFCVDVEDSGQCVSKAASENEDCDAIPGTHARFRNRHVGASGVSSSSANVCVPDKTTAATGDLAADLLALTEECARIPGTDLFRTDAGKSRTIPMCQLEGAIWWRADGDIDCDGGRSEPCTSDPWYQASTSSKDSSGKFIDSANVPHFVVPMTGSGFRASDFGIRTGWNAVGSAGAILYEGKLIFAPYADAGPRHVLGELSAAAAEALGIPNHPVSGGVPDGVTYIVFTGNDAYVDPIESRDAADSIGEELAQRLLDNN